MPSNSSRIILFGQNTKQFIAIDRREALAGFAGGLACSLLPSVAHASADRRLFFSARGIRIGGKLSMRASGIDDVGRLVFDIPIPGRAHGLAQPEVQGLFAGQGFVIWTDPEIGHVFVGVRFQKFHAHLDAFPHPPDVVGMLEILVVE